MLVGETAVVRARVALGGTVQGVGFRPFVYRLAKELELAGWVCNSNAGLVPKEVSRLGDQMGRMVFGG